MLLIYASLSKMQCRHSILGIFTILLLVGSGKPEDLPALGADLAGRVDTANYTSITVSFLKWTNEMPGEVPPTVYQVEISGGDISQIVPHSNESSITRVNTTWTGLTPGQTYMIIVNCRIQEDPCDGVPYTFNVSTEPCADPAPPSELQLQTPSLQLNDGRNKWNYTAVWQEPSEVNCAGPATYQYGINGTITSEDTTNTSVTFYLDGYQTYKFIVVTKNSVGKISSSVNENGRTVEIAPQFAPTNIQLTPTSSDCVKLEWSPPLHPGGLITGYEYKCADDTEWKHTADEDVRDVEICEHDPHTNVTCDIRAANGAENDAGKSECESKSAITDCAAPSPPRTLRIQNPTLTVHDGRNVWNYTATWKAPSEVNCRGSTTYNYGIHGVTNIVDITETSVTFYLDGNLKYNFIVVARNSDGSLSSSVNKKDSTPQIAPQFAPTNVSLTANSSNCVQLQWSPPLHTGGPITSYEYRCTDVDWKHTTDGAVMEVDICLYRPYTNVTCDIRAVNEAENAEGKSEYETKSNSTHCAEPKFIESPTANDTYNSIDNSRQIEVHLDMIELNCEKQKSVEYQIDNGEFTENSLFDGLDALTTYNITVKITNDQTLSADTTIHVETGELRPYDAPKFVNTSYVKGTCVKVFWTDPLEPNGVIQYYKYRCMGEDLEEPMEWTKVTVKYVEICDYDLGVKFNCSVTAVTGPGAGPVNTTVVQVPCKVPKFIKSPTANDTYNSNDNSRQIEVDLLEIELYCVPQHLVEYQINDGEFTETNIFDGLDAVTNYTITVKVTNNQSLSANTTIPVKTGELRPGDAPKFTDVSSVNETCVRVYWTDPLEPNGVIRHYKYRCIEHLEESVEWANVSSNYMTLCDYDAGVLLTCNVMAATKLGYGPNDTTVVEIPCKAPSSPWFNVTSFSEVANDTGLVVMSIYLEEPIPNCRNIKHYNISVINEDSITILIEIRTEDGEFNVSSFNAYTRYNVSITAFNDDNIANETSRSILTIETRPRVSPAKFDMETDTSCVDVSASQPQPPNGLITHYEFACNSSADHRNVSVIATEDTLDGIARMCGFYSATEVYCTATAINKAGPSPPGSSSEYTQLKVINTDDSKPKVQDPEPGSLTVGITINKIVTQNLEISSYIILLAKQSNGTRRKRSLTTECEGVLDVKQASPQTNTNCYVAAELNITYVGEETSFEIGDGKQYGRYNNTALEQGATYNVYSVGMVSLPDGHGVLYTPAVALQILAPVEVVTEVSSTTQEISVTSVSSTTSESDKTDGAGTIAGAVVGGLVFAALVAGIIFCIRRRRQRTNSRKSWESSHAVTDIPMTCQTPAIQPKPASVKENRSPEPNRQRPVRDDKENGAYGNIADIPMPSEAIPVHKLAWFIGSNGDLIKKQYEMLEKLPKPIMNAALAPENKGKSRYKGVYPADEHRVKLQRNGDGGTDFINAVYMMGYSRDKQYIAAQGPTTANIEDFWLMIWQQQPSVIIMVTKAVENGKPKCDQYWPLSKGETQIYESVEVSLISSDVYADFAVNTLQVHNGQASRTITHFNYLSWPDHSVPEDTNAFVTFYRKIKSATGHLQGPALVHCSAGVGRTGTYIALDYLLEQADAEQKLDVFDYVRAMRSRRPAMIQTVRQYEFLHHALHEAFSTPGFSCSLMELDNRISIHHQQPDSEDDIISAEFRHISKTMKTLNLNFATAKEPENRAKNRFSEILPYENYMPYLTGAVGIYINAVIVDGYRKKKQWFATQLPLSNTISDFWELILEQDVKVIVQLEQQQTPFYPTKDSPLLNAQHISVDRVRAKDSNYVRTITVKVESEKESREVYVLFLKSWTFEEPLPTHQMLISLQEAVGQLQQQTGDGKMCVTCMDGSTRCGLFFCAYNAMEKLKAEQEVDVYNPVIMSKLRRPQFVQTIEQYSFLYDVLKEYAGSFATYANVP